MFEYSTDRQLKQFEKAYLKCYRKTKNLGFLRVVVLIRKAFEQRRVTRQWLGY